MECEFRVWFSRAAAAVKYAMDSDDSSDSDEMKWKPTEAATEGK